MIESIKTALMITAFVSVTMLLIEYLNVRTGGAWQQRLAHRRMGQYVVAAVLGVTPGCLGSFAAVAMYSHGALTLGSVVTTMITTSGDESFVMLALIPKQALLLAGILVVIGIAVGALVDALWGARRMRQAVDCLEIHPADRVEVQPAGRILQQWKDCSPARGTMAGALVLFLAALASRELAAEELGWVRISLAVTSVLALFVVATVPDHFLEEHLWRHVVMRHSPRIFLWTAGTLLVLQFVTDRLQLEAATPEGRWLMLGAACLIGLIPESGPHLIFVTLYAKGALPFSVLLASSIVQDGHGMLPMLAHSRREFLVVKGINLAAGLLVGAAALSLGF